MHYRADKIKYSRVTTGPEVEPITLAEAKAQCKLDSDFNDDDDLLAILIATARELVEDITNRSLISQTRVMRFDHFPPCSTVLELTHGRLISVTSLKYYDEDDAQQTMSADDYWVDTHSEIPRIVIKEDWPTTYERPNAVEVIYVAGYGTSVSDIPKRLKQAVAVITAHLYDHRGDEKGFDIPELAITLLSPYVINQDAWY